MNTSEKTINSSETAEEILKSARQKVDAQQKPKSQSSSSNSNSSESEKRPRPKLVKASDRSGDKAIQAVTEYQETEKTLALHEAQENMLKGAKKAAKHVQYQDLGYLKALSQYSVESAKQRYHGMQALEEQVDESLGQSEEFNELMEAGLSDPLDLSVLPSSKPLSGTSTGIFQLLLDA